MDLQIQNIQPAYIQVLKNLEKSIDFKIENIIPINNNRYIIAEGSPYNILITFKKELFLSYGKMFEKEGESGIGESINVEDLKIAIRHNVKRIFTMFPDEKTYTISIDEFLQKSHKWTNKEGKEIRSTSIHNYVRVFENVK